MTLGVFLRIRPSSAAPLTLYHPKGDPAYPGTSFTGRPLPVDYTG
jgi:hypothetical protein